MDPVDPDSDPDPQHCLKEVKQKNYLSLQPAGESGGHTVGEGEQDLGGSVPSSCQDFPAELANKNSAANRPLASLTIPHTIS